MPLVLSLREGQDFFLGDEQVVVGRVHGIVKFEVKVKKTGKCHEISDAESVEILPDVFLSAGDRPQKGIARVAIDAPREIKITRGDRYRENAA